MQRMKPIPPAGAGASPGQARAIRRRLLERVADADTSHTTIHADEGDWQPFVDGVSIKVLHEHDGVLSYLLRLAPGAALPPHRHPLDEECLVLDGTLLVGTHTEVQAGGYHLAHRGALHATVSTRIGATIFLRGAAPQAEHVLG
jgi:quercetin dioxygenase-like cupin family protein